jgi:DNA anti-recombination protein RmuC
MTEKVSTSISLTAKNRDYLDREVNNRSGFINDLIDAHREGKSEMDEAIARFRREQLEQELNSVTRREDEIRNELETLNEQITQEQQRKQEKLEDAKEAIGGMHLTADNPAVKNWAENVGMSPEELLEELDE